MITILGPPLAPPVELARWILEVRDIPHDFQPLGAGLSAITSRRHDLPVELPIILTDTGAVGGAIGGLRAGFGFVSGSAAGHAPPVFDKALVASLFDGLFSQGVRTFYVHMLEAPAVLVPLATGGVPASHRWFIKTMFGTWRRAMRHYTSASS